jgi:long-chain acyl-CoA synthetase
VSEWFRTCNGELLTWLAETAKFDVEDMVSSNVYPIPPPTILFLKPGHLENAVSSIAKEASKSFILYPFARRHKQASISEGYITKESLWDRLLFDGARAKVIGDGASMRGAIVSGGKRIVTLDVETIFLKPISLASLSGSLLTQSRIMLSMPLVNCFTHPLVPGPVLASHPLDLQDFSTVVDGGIPTAHVGPPSVNIETKLVDVNDALVENGGDPAGELLIRGPSVGKLLSSDDYVSIPSEDDKEGWMLTGVRVKIHTNGAFQVLAK